MTSSIFTLLLFGAGQHFNYQGPSADGGTDWASTSKLTDQSGVPLATSSNPLRTDPTGVTAQPVSGTLTCVVSLPTGAATSALQTTGNTSLASIDTKTPALASGRVPVDGSGVTQPVSGTLTCSGPLTDAQLRASAVPVSLASTTVTGNVAVTNAGLTNIDVLLSTRTKPADQQHVVIDSSASLAVTGPLTDTQLRASPVITTIDGGSMYVIQPNASALNATVSGTLTCNAGSGTLAVSVASLPLPSGASTSALQTTGNTSLSSIDTKTPALVSGRVPVDGSGVTQPVSGTFFQATQPVSLTSTTITGSVAVTGPLTDTQLRASPVIVTLDGGTVGLLGTSNGNGTNGAALRVTVASDSTGVLACTESGTWNITNVSGTVSLPTGASTAAKQPALGTAGSASTDVLSVQGIASMTALKVDGSAVTQPVSIATAPVLVAGSAIIGKVGLDQTTPGTTNACSIAQIGANTVATGTGASSTGTIRVMLATDSALAANQSSNVAQINGVTPLMGTGATGTGSPRVTLATNSPGYSTSGGTIAVDSQLQASRAVAYGSSPTAIAATTQAPAIGDLEGRQYVNIGHPRAINCVLTTTATTSTQITGCEVVASNSIYITAMGLCGDIANATATPAILQSGTSTACTGPHILWSGYHPALSCINMQFNPPIKATVAEGLCILDGTTGTKKANIVAYVAP